MDKQKIISIFSVMCAIFIVSCSSAPKTEPVPEEVPVQEEVQPVKEPVVEPVIVPVPEPVQEEKPVEPVVQEPDYAAQNKILLDKVLAARDMAIVAGADTLFPDEFAALDESFAFLRHDVEQTPDDKTFADSLQDTLDMYQAFEQLALALAAKDRIDSLGFSSYDLASYEAGNKAVDSIYALYQSDNPVSGSILLEQAGIALSSYTTVLVNGFKTLSEQERSAALAVKAQADEIKASKAAKDAYAAAALQFSQADTFFNSQDYEDSYNGFSQAHMSFQTVFTDVSARRSAAQQAMDKAKQKEAEVFKYAEEADEIAPLPVEDEVPQDNTETGKSNTEEVQ